MAHGNPGADFLGLAVRLAGFLVLRGAFGMSGSLVHGTGRGTEESAIPGAESLRRGGGRVG